MALFPWCINRLKSGIQFDFLGTNQRMAPCVVSAVILVGGFFCWQQVSLDAYRGERPFAMELKALVAGLSPEQIAFYCTLKTNTLFYLDMAGPVRLLKDSKSVQDFLQSCRGDRVLITKRKYSKDLSLAVAPELRRQPTLSEQVYPWQGKSIEKLIAWKIREKGE